MMVWSWYGVGLGKGSRVKSSGKGTGHSPGLAGVVWACLAEVFWGWERPSKGARDEMGWHGPGEGSRHHEFCRQLDATRKKNHTE